MSSPSSDLPLDLDLEKGAAGPAATKDEELPVLNPHVVKDIIALVSLLLLPTFSCLFLDLPNMVPHQFQLLSDGYAPCHWYVLLVVGRSSCRVYLCIDAFYYFLCKRVTFVYRGSTFQLNLETQNTLHL